MKKLLLLLFAGLLLAGCAAREEPEGDPVEFTVMTQEDAPEELKRQMEEKCREGFRLTYEDEGWLYAAVGYGAGPAGATVCRCARAGRRKMPSTCIRPFWGRTAGMPGAAAIHIRVSC